MRPRDSGTTTRQLLKLKENDIFLVLNNSQLSYISHLCAKHEIPKIKIQTVQSFLSNLDKFKGYLGRISCDHSCFETNILSHMEKERLLNYMNSHNYYVEAHNE